MNHAYNKVRYSFAMDYQVPVKQEAGLPDFIIVGAQKAGTTALAKNLAGHPELFMAAAADRVHAWEVHFFNNEQNWSRGIDWYKNHFSRPDLLQGEKTPEYLASFVAHERMHQVVPNAKLILLLRNPVDRAYSLWNHFNQIIEKSKNWGWEKKHFEEAIADSLNSKNHVFNSILERGKYIKQIRNLMTYYKEEQLFLGVAERFKENPSLETNRVFRFLGVGPMKIESGHHHVRQYEKPMEPAIRRFLEAYYASYNEELFDFLGHRIDEWGPL